MAMASLLSHSCDPTLILIPTSTSRIPASPRRHEKHSKLFFSIRETSSSSSATTTGLIHLKKTVPEFREPKSNSLFSSTVTTQKIGECLVRLQPAELGLLSLLLVVSMAVGAFTTLALTSLPTMHALSKLKSSAEKLAKIASEEVPGTLFSFRLSGMEINDLIQQLSRLRQRSSANTGSSRKSRNSAAAADSMEL